MRAFFAVAYAYGTRKGQLARTRRRYVDLERGVIEWPAVECKHKEAHVLPLDQEGLVIVERMMTKPPLWCPFLFHGLRCAPGAVSSKAYGCLGDFKKVWTRACKKAGLPVGRRAGGYVFHHTRNTAATNLRAGGMEEADAMKITGHQTAHVFRHYNLGDVDSFRARLARARDHARTATVRPLHGRRPSWWTAAGGSLHVTNFCTAAAQQNGCRV